VVGPSCAEPKRFERRALAQVIAVAALAAGVARAGAGEGIDLVARVQALLPASPGACVLAFDQGEIVFQHAYGLADVENSVACTPQTNFRMASVSKQFTAFAVMLLVDRGKLHLDDTLDKFFPGFPAYGRRIALRHLLTHTSGLPDYEELIPAGTTLQLDDTDVLHLIMESDQPLFSPGEKWQYSNSAFVLLGLIVETVAEKPFHVFMADEVFEPLEMTGTCVYQLGLNEVSDRAYGHEQKDGRWVRADQSVTSATRGDGCVYTSLVDYGKWLGALDAGRLVSTASRRAMFSPQAESDRGGAHYGFGWFIDQFEGTKRIYHNGDTRGFRLAVQTFPERRAAVLMQLNGETAEDLTKVGQRLAKALIFERQD
jgi:CubicO group peptidase (beta-lactamase class C family)